MKRSEFSVGEPVGASLNPWWALATLQGPQFGIALGQMDADLHQCNRRAWNRWMSAALDPEVRRALVADGWLAPDEVEPYSNEERRDFAAAFAMRAGADAPPPEPGAPISFAGERFDVSLCLHGYLFPADVDFSAAQFGGSVNFTGAVFLGAAQFRRCRFERSLFFNRAHLAGRIDFTNVAFHADADFSEARLADYAIFHHAGFHARAMFNEAQFDAAVDFRAARFDGTADFAEAVLRDEAAFDHACFTGDAQFHGARFEALAEFASAYFAGNADFSLGAFTGRCSLTAARFQTLPPDFRGADAAALSLAIDGAWPAPVPGRAHLAAGRYQDLLNRARRAGEARTARRLGAALRHSQRAREIPRQGQPRALFSAIADHRLSLICLALGIAAIWALSAV